MIEMTEDHDEMRAMALGERPFRVNAHYERLAELDQREQLKRLTPGERLSLGFYLRAKLRAAARVGPSVGCVARRRRRRVVAHARHD